MAITSISLDDHTLNEIAKLQKEIGFEGRSETIRAAVKSLASEHKEIRKLSNISEAALILTYPEKYAKDIMQLRHHFQGTVKTQNHTHLSEHMCMDFLVVEGKGEHIQKLYEECKAHGKMNVVRLVPL